MDLHPAILCEHPITTYHPRRHNTLSHLTHGPTGPTPCQSAEPACLTPAPATHASHSDSQQDQGPRVSPTNGRSKPDGNNITRNRGQYNPHWSDPSAANVPTRNTRRPARPVPSQPHHHSTATTTAPIQHSPSTNRTNPNCSSHHASGLCTTQPNMPLWHHGGRSGCTIHYAICGKRALWHPTSLQQPSPICKKGPIHLYLCHPKTSNPSRGCQDLQLPLHVEHQPLHQAQLKGTIL